jgi:hypothetical protein
MDADGRPYCHCDCAQAVDHQEDGSAHRARPGPDYRKRIARGAAQSGRDVRLFVGASVGRVPGKYRGRKRDFGLTVRLKPDTTSNTVRYCACSYAAHAPPVVDCDVFCCALGRSLWRRRRTNVANAGNHRPDVGIIRRSEWCDSTVSCRCLAGIRPFYGAESRVEHDRRFRPELLSALGNLVNVGWPFRGTDVVAGQQPGNGLALHSGRDFYR